jgi:hypothetical protein
MNQSKFSLADVLTILTALAFGFLCFLGTNFYTLGNTTKSITAAVIIAFLLFGTAYSAKLLKRTSVNFKTCFIWEIILLLIFTLLFVFFTYMPFSHYFTVSTKQTVIVDKIQKSIAQAQNMFPAYETYAKNRKKIYESKLKSVIAAKIMAPENYKNYGFNNVMFDEHQFKKKMENINADLFPTNYSDVKTQKGIKEVATNWLFQAKEATENWKPVGITNVVVTIEDKTTEWKNILVNLSQILQKGETSAETKEFTYPSPEFPDVKQFFTKVEKPGIASLLIALLLWVLMLLSWFVTKRSTKSTIFKSKIKSEFDVKI